MVSGVSGNLNAQIANLSANLQSSLNGANSDFSSQINYLSASIDYVVENLDPVALDSLTEIVSAFQSSDSSLMILASSSAFAAS